MGITLLSLSEAIAPYLILFSNTQHDNKGKIRFRLRYIKQLLKNRNTTYGFQSRELKEGCYKNAKKTLLVGSVDSIDTYVIKNEF